MDDALVVRRLERLGDRERDPQRLLERELAAGEPRRQLLALDHSITSTRLAVGLLEPVDRGDVGMVERGEHLGLAFEATHGLQVLRPAPRA